MPLRENLIVAVGFFFLYLLNKLDSQEKWHIPEIILMAVLYGFILASHLLVFFFISGVLGLYFLSRLFQKKSVLPLIGLIIGGLLIAAPFVTPVLQGVFFQVQHLDKIMAKTGVGLSQSFIKISDLGLPFIPVFAAIGLVYFLKQFFASPRADIGKNKITPNEEVIGDYEKCFHELYDYVDYFVVNVSSPNTPNLRELQEKEPLTKLLSHLKQINKSKPKEKPILLKIAPDLTNEQLDDIISIVKDTKIDGVIAIRVKEATNAFHHVINVTNAPRL